MVGIIITVLYIIIGLVVVFDNWEDIVGAQVSNWNKLGVLILLVAEGPVLAVAAILQTAIGILLGFEDDEGGK